MHPSIILMIPVFALADRWSGGGLGWDKLAHDHGGPLRGHPLTYAMVPVFAACVLLAHAPGVGLALLWIGYRTIPNPKGTLDATNLINTVLRHIVPAFVVAMAGIIKAWQPYVVLPFLIYAAISTLLAIGVGEGRSNAAAELTRGGTFGASVIGFLWLLQLTSN